MDTNLPTAQPVKGFKENLIGKLNTGEDVWECEESKHIIIGDRRFKEIDNCTFENK